MSTAPASTRLATALALAAAVLVACGGSGSLEFLHTGSPTPPASPAVDGTSADEPAGTCEDVVTRLLAASQERLDELGTSPIDVADRDRLLFMRPGYPDAQADIRGLGCSAQDVLGRFVERAGELRAGGSAAWVAWSGMVHAAMNALAYGPAPSAAPSFSPSPERADLDADLERLAALRLGPASSCADLTEGVLRLVQAQVDLAARSGFSTQVRPPPGLRSVDTAMPGLLARSTCNTRRVQLSLLAHADQVRASGFFANASKAEVIHSIAFGLHDGPGVDVTLVPSPSTARPGEDVEVSVIVENTGSIRLDRVRLSRTNQTGGDLLKVPLPVLSIEDLPTGEKRTLHARFTVPRDTAPGIWNFGFDTFARAGESSTQSPYLGSIRIRR